MWALVRDEVIAHLRTIVHTNRLIITGISLGGGLACLSLIGIYATGHFHDLEVITFGAPRVGNQPWAEYFNSIAETTRIYIEKDPINNKPSCKTPVCDYSPVGRPVVCYPDYQICSFEEMKSSTITDGWRYLVRYLKARKEQGYGSIIDHIVGYKKIKNYELI